MKEFCLFVPTVQECFQMKKKKKKKQKERKKEKYSNGRYYYMLTAIRRNKGLVSIFYFHQRNILVIEVKFKTNTINKSLKNTAMWSGKNTMCRYTLTITILLGDLADNKLVIFFLTFEKTGPSCSKLTMWLVNDSLKLTSSDMQIR